MSENTSVKSLPASEKKAGKEKKTKTKKVPSLNLSKVFDDSNSASSSDSCSASDSSSDSCPDSPIYKESSGSQDDLLFAHKNQKDQENKVGKSEGKSEDKVDESPRTLLGQAAEVLSNTELNRSGTTTPRSDYQGYQKLRESSQNNDMRIISPREFFNCTFCGRSVSPRGGTRVVKKTDLILSYNKEKESKESKDQSSDKEVPVETSCADCSMKVKSFCNSPRRFQREKSSDFSGFSSPAISPIQGRSPRGPPSPMLNHQLTTPSLSFSGSAIGVGGTGRSPVRLTGLERRTSNPLSAVGGAGNINNRRNTSERLSYESFKETRETVSNPQGLRRSGTFSGSNFPGSAHSNVSSSNFPSISAKETLRLSGSSLKTTNTLSNKAPRLTQSRSMSNFSESTASISTSRSTATSAVSASSTSSTPAASPISVRNS